MNSCSRFHRILAGTVSVFLTLVLTAPAESQIPEDREIGRGFFQAGYFGLDLDELNGSLAGAGFPSLGHGFLSLGGAGYGNRGRFLIGGEGHGLLGQDETTADGAYQISASGGYGLFRVGYLAFSENGFDVFPVIGIGGGALGIKIAERSAPTFEDVLDSPGRSSSLSTGMFLMDASIEANYRIDVANEEDGRRGGFLVGLQVGYAFAPGETSWRLDEINGVAAGPQFQIEGLHVRVSLGGWGEEEPE